MRFTSCMHYSHIFNVIGQQISIFHVLPCIHTYSRTQTSAGGWVFFFLFFFLFCFSLVCLFVSLVNSNSTIPALKTLPRKLFHQTLTRPILSQTEGSGVQTVTFAACRIKIVHKNCEDLETTVGR